MKRKRGRKEHLDPPVEKALSLPSSVVAEVELRLYDPSTQKTRYGAFAQLVESLLRQWLSEQKGTPHEPTRELPADSPSGSQENPPHGTSDGSSE